MADLGNYQDKLLQDDPNEQQTQASNVTPTAGTSGVISGGSNASGVSTAGVGAGGTGGWTNIQAYLGANKGDNGSATALSDKANTQYDNEKNNLNTKASETKTQAQSQANKITDAQNNSKEWVSSAAKAYDYGGQQNDDYNNQTQKLRSALYDQYGGPSSFAYETSADFQRTGSALKDNSAFNNYMNDIYKDKAGGTLTSGQGALQTQLDVNNQNLADARKNLLSRYSGFGDEVNNVVKDTDTAIQSAKSSYGNNQQNLKSYLGNLANDYDSQQAQAEAAARAGYNQDYTTGQSGMGNTWNGLWYDNAKSRGASDLGIGGNNLTWEAIQRERNFADQGAKMGSVSGNNVVDSVKKDYGYLAGNSLDPRVSSDPVLNRTFGTAKNNFDRNQSALAQFYADQDAKYSNTADSEKRNWNTIMDILNNSARKNQGFQVRA